MSQGTLIGLLGLLALGCAYLVLFLRRGMEYRLPGRRHYQSDPDALGLPPALVGHVWRMGHASVHDVSATILDLVDRGWIELEPPIRPRRFILRDDGAGSPMTHERVLLALLFEDAGSDGRLEIADLEEYSRRQRDEFRSRLADFESAIATWATEQGVFESEGRRWVWRAMAIGWLAAAWCLALLIIGRSALVFVVGIALTILMYVLADRMWRRSRKFARLYDDAEALRRYMRDFGRMDEKSAAAVVLWSRYLIFAEEFAMAGQLRRELLHWTGDSIYPLESFTFVLDRLPLGRLDSEPEPEASEAEPALVSEADERV